MIYSFDIFDTLITRTTATPKGIFAVMQKQLYKNEKYNDLPLLVREKFYEIRVDAEREARETNRITKKITEVTLDEIYTLMQYMHGLTDQQRELLKNLELETEFDNCVPIWYNINALKAYREKNPVYLISDMYLTENIIRKILVKIDVIFKDIPIMVSCDYGKTKAEGKLYDIFLEENKVIPKEWIHIGDNKVSDAVQVEIRGGNAKLFQTYPYTVFEEKIILQNENVADFQLVLGTVKNTLLKKNAAYEIGRRFGGPILYGYIQWVLEYAETLNINDLYFIARDGYVLKAIADVIIEQKGLDIETHYLYGSRKAWRLPAVSDNIEELKGWFENKCRFYSIDDLCNAVSMDRETLMGFLPSVVSVKATNLNNAEIRFIRNLLLGNDDFFAFVWKTANQKKIAAEAYLKQEIKNKHGYAFVELNGTGYTQQCLYNLLGNSEQNVISFFYTLAGVNTPDNTNNIFYKYTFERFEIDDILETFCRAPHGQTLGYVCVNGKWKPLLEDNLKDYPDESDYKHYMEGLLEFSQTMCENKGSDGIGLNAVAIDYIRHVCSEPEEDVLTFVGDIPFISRSAQADLADDVGNKSQSYAPRLTEEDIKRIYLYGDSSWYEEKYSPTSRKYMQYRLTERDKELIEFYSQVRQRLHLSIFSQKTEPAIKVRGRLAIYGAGIRGKRVYRELIDKNEIKIVAWVDKNYEKCESEEFQVTNPNSLKTVDFDLLLIAVADKDIVSEINQYLMSMGIPENKIVMY